MKITISSKNYNVTEKLTAIIEKKLSRMSKYFSEDAECDIHCKKENKNDKMEVTIVHKGHKFRGEVTTTNMYANIDIVLPKIEKQIIKHKDRLKEKIRKEAYEEKKLAYHLFMPKIEQTEIVKFKHYEVDQITHDEAVVMLDTLGHDFYVYSNKVTGCINVIYKREDGNCGVIEVDNSKITKKAK